VTIFLRFWDVFYFSVLSNVKTDGDDDGDDDDDDDDDGGGGGTGDRHMTSIC